MSAMSQFLDKLDSEKVTINVGQGDTAKQFAIPQDLLTSRSKWFAGALKDGNFVEGQKKEILLPEDSPSIFEAFLFHLYNQNIVFRTDREKSSEGRGAELTMAFGIWMFGDKYLLTELQNCAMHRACAVFDDGVWTNALPVAALLECFQSAEAGSPFRVLIADYLVNKLEKDSDASDVHNLVLTEGLLLALHASEGALHKLPKGDFPRYMKPTKHADVLFAKGQLNEEAECETTYLGSGWNAPISYCQECGFDGAIYHHCKGCRELKCTCNSWDFMLLCHDCSAS